MKNLLTTCTYFSEKDTSYTCIHTYIYNTYMYCGKERFLVYIMNTNTYAKGKLIKLKKTSTAVSLTPCLHHSQVA